MLKREIKGDNPSDSELVRGILAGSGDTLRQLYKNYFPMVMQLVLTNNGDEDEAKDVFQEAVIVFYNKVQEGNFTLSSKLSTYLYSVARRVWLKKLSHLNRKSGSLAELEQLIPVEQDIEQQEERDIQFALMETSLSKLGEPCKTIIEDFYLHNQSMQDICEKFGYTNADNAKNQKYKCLQRLKKIFFQA